MNNKIAINIYQQLNLKNKLHKEEQRIMDTENILIVARLEEGVWE